MDPTVSTPPKTNPPRVTESQFLGAIWGGTAVSFVFLAVRLFSRVKSHRRLYWDDALIIFAWILALLSAIDWQIISGFLYAFLGVTSGQTRPPADFVINTERYYVGQLIALIFFYTSLYSVKLSFLLFFKRLGHNVTRQRYIWWPVLLFTIAAYCVCIGDTQYKCIIGPFADIAAQCGTEENMKFTLDTIKANCVLDVFSDFLIMIIPFTMLWNAQMRWKRKLALMGIFSLVIITMLFSMIRVALVSIGVRQPDMTWLYLWTSVEQDIAIIVCALSAFPRLFAQSAASSSDVGFKPSDTYKSMMRRIRSGERKRDFVELSMLRTDDDDHDHGNLESQNDVLKNYPGPFPAHSVSSELNLVEPLPLRIRT